MGGTALKMQYKEIYDKKRADGIVIGKKRGRREGIVIGRKAGLVIGRRAGIAIGREDGITIGEEIERMKTVCRLLRNRISIEVIHAATDLPIETLGKLRKEYNRDTDAFLAKYGFADSQPQAQR